jgi:hypothetical protein
MALFQRLGRHYRIGIIQLGRIDALACCCCNDGGVGRCRISIPVPGWGECGLQQTQCSKLKRGNFSIPIDRFAHIGQKYVPLPGAELCERRESQIHSHHALFGAQSADRQAQRTLAALVFKRALLLCVQSGRDERPSAVWYFRSILNLRGQRIDGSTGGERLLFGCAFAGATVQAV